MFIFFASSRKASWYIDNTEADIKAVKVLRDGQIYILRDGKEYNVMGVMVK